MSAGAAPDDDRLAGLFEQALALSGERRRAFLDEVCGGDARLRAELDSLLVSHDSAPDFLEHLGARVLAPALDALGPLSADSDPLGQTVGHYRILGRLGAGGMGEVFRARDLDLGRDVALKFLPPHLAAHGPARERLRREARVASGLDHPNIAVVHEIGTAPATATEPLPRTFIAMACCGEHTLADELEREGRLSIARALDCAIQLVDALSCTHEAGIAHLDVKPTNLIVTDRGSLKLVDFGLATRPESAASEAASGGTVAYMSPEQLAGGPVDHRADLWAAGVVLHELLAGARPFTGARAEQLALAICRDEPPPLCALRSDVTPRLEALVRRCLAKAPLERYASAAALLTDLRTLADTHGEGAGGASLAVLPFEHASDPPIADTGFLGEGLAEEIITDLSRVRALRVIARASSRRLKGSGRDAAAVARELGVRHALVGSITTREGDLRVSASLIEARTGHALRTLTFEGRRDELLAMRRELVRAVVASLGLSPAAVDQAGVPDARAYEAYLRARHEAWSFSAAGLQRARRHLEAAIELVGEHELLYGTLGHVAALHADSGLAPAADVLAEVETLAERVFSLNPRSAQGHWLRCWAAFQRGDLHAAIRSGEHAHALEPDDPDVLLLLGYVYAHADRNHDARVLLERCLLLDPLTPLTQGVQGFVPILEGRPAEAIEPYRRALEMEPESPFFATFLGWALAYDRRLDEATQVLDGVARRFPGTVFASYAGSLSHGLAGRSDQALAAITPAFEAAAEGSEMFARELAHCRALAGDAAGALRWLSRAVDLGMWNHAYLAEHDWFLDGVRGEPGFDRLLERVRTAKARGGQALR